MFKKSIPTLAAPLCLTLSAAACGSKSPEDVADSFCLKIIECAPAEYKEQAEMYVDLCKAQFEVYFEQIREEYGEACWEAYADLFDCYYGDATCSELNEGTSGNRCQDEYDEAEAKCENFATIPENTTLRGFQPAE